MDKTSSQYKEASHKFAIYTDSGLRAQVYYKRSKYSVDGFGSQEGFRIYPCGDKTYGITAFCIYRLHKDGKLPHITRVGSPSKDLTR